MAVTRSTSGRRYQEVPKESAEAEGGRPDGSGFGVRHGQALIFFVCVAVGYVVNTHAAVTVVAMTAPAPRRATEDPGTYSWSKPQQELVLMAFFVGTGLMMFPIGVVCQRLGGKRPLVVALLLAGLISLPVPWLSHWGGWAAAAACRLAQGMAMSAVLPAAHTLLARWAPASERGKLTSFVFTGTTAGTVAGYQLSGLLVGSGGGWPSVWYGVAALCGVAAALLAGGGADSPDKHPRISEAERIFITRRIDEDIGKARATPWRRVLASRSAWAAFVAQAGTGVAYVLCMVQVPTYVHHVLGFQLRSSAFLSSLPFVAKFLTGIGVGYVSDFCINRQMLSTETMRKIANSVGEMGIAVSLAAVTFTTNDALAITCLIFSMGAYAVTYSGWLVNYIDLAPRHSGALLAFGNTLSDVLLMAMPFVVSHAVTDLTDRTQWRPVFLAVAALAFACALVFVFLMSADTQPWNGAADQQNGTTDPEGRREESEGTE